ncbi:MAG: PIG-L family deacetylase [Methylobacter sp.]
MENLLIPYFPGTVPSAKVVLVVAPHPDDEVFGCGGAIMRHLQNGEQVKVVIISDGAFGAKDEEKPQIVAQREAESRKAANVLGYGEPEFWRLPDRGVIYGEALIRRLMEKIQSTAATLVYAPSPLEMHPDHRATAMCAIEAIRRGPANSLLALYEIGIPIHPNLLLDISDLTNRKMAAMECFASQNEKQRYDLDIAALNRYRTYTLPSEVTAAEAYTLVSAEELANDPFKLYQSEYKRQRELGLALDNKDVPLVSVIIRSMDRSTLLETLDSVALQTYSNIEVVVVNAKGEEHSKLSEWCGHFPLQIVATGDALRRSRAGNMGLNNARGDYLIFLDDDDTFAPNHIAGLVQALHQHPQAKVVYAGIRAEDNDGHLLSIFNEPYDHRKLLISNFIPIHALLFSRDLAEKNAVRFDENMDIYEDWDLWLQLSRHTTFLHINQISAVYNAQGNSGVGLVTDKDVQQQGREQLFDKWRLRWTGKDIAGIAEYMAERNREIANLAQALAERDVRITNLNHILTERDEQIAHLDQVLTERDRQIADLYNSTSWKVTKPLRIASRQMKRIQYVTRLAVPALKRGGGIKNTFRKALRIYQSEGFQGIKRGFRLIAASQIVFDNKNIDPAYLKVVTYPAEKLLGSRVLIIAEMSIPQCKKYRVQQKCDMFKSLGIDCTMLKWNDTQECLEALQTHSLVIFYRVPAFESVVSVINEAKRLRIPTIWEVDDFIFDKEVLANSKTLEALDRNTFEELIEGANLYRKAMLLCDRGVASTTGLADAMRSAGLPEVHVIENALDQQTLEVAENVCREHSIHQDGNIRIIYGSGTNTHNIDFEEAAPAIIKVLDNFPNVRLRLVGRLDLPETFSSYKNQVERLPVCTYEEYLCSLAECDINIAPLENYVFNDSKSNIKYLEAAIVKIPSVCSPRAAFAQVIIHGENGFLCDTDDEWEAALTLLVTDATKRAEVGKAAYSSVISRYSPKNIAQQQVAPLLKHHDRNPNILRVLSVNCYYSPRSFGGATIVAEEINKHLNAQDGIEVHAFTTLPSSVTAPYTIKRYEADGINVYGVGLPDLLDEKTKFENRKIVGAFAEALAVVQPDIVHFHSIQGIGVSVIDLCSQKGIKYIVTLHDAWWLCGRQFMITKKGAYCEQKEIDLAVCATCVENNNLNLYRNQRLATALHNASALLAPSRFFADFHIANGFANVQVNRNGIVKPRNTRRSRREGALRFGYVGGNTKIKGFHLVKKVFSDLTNSSLRLVLVDNALNLGFTSYHQEDLAGIHNVEIVPAYTQNTIDDFFADIDVLLFPTQSKESFGLTIREALARNVWVITTDAGGVAEDIRPGQNGYIVPFSDTGEGLKQAVIDTLEYFEQIGPGEQITLGETDIIFFEDQAAELTAILNRVHTGSAAHIVGVAP